MTKNKGNEEPYSVQFARLGGLARARKLSAAERNESARKAAKARWAKEKAVVKLKGSSKS
jgi:hypothetical protein